MDSGIDVVVIRGRFLTITFITHFIFCWVPLAVAIKAVWIVKWLTVAVAMDEGAQPVGREGKGSVCVRRARDDCLDRVPMWRKNVPEA